MFSKRFEWLPQRQRRQRPLFDDDNDLLWLFLRYFFRRFAERNYLLIPLPRAFKLFLLLLCASLFILWRLLWFGFVDVLLWQCFFLYFAKTFLLFLLDGIRNDALLTVLFLQHTICTVFCSMITFVFSYIHTYSK